MRLKIHRTEYWSSHLKSRHCLYYLYHNECTRAVKDTGNDEKSDCEYGTNERAANISTFSIFILYRKFDSIRRDPIVHFFNIIRIKIINNN